MSSILTFYEINDFCIKPSALDFINLISKLHLNFITSLFAISFQHRLLLSQFNIIDLIDKKTNLLFDMEK